MNKVTDWMSWQNGIDLVAITNPLLQKPNVMVHLGNMVHTPVGSAPSGMIYWQPDVNEEPLVFGFVGTDLSVGNYFGPNIFEGTLFETAPVLKATIDINIGTKKAYSKCVVGTFTFEIEMSEFGAPCLIDRTSSGMAPFYQQGVEIPAKKTTLKINGESITINIPSIGLNGRPASVVSPNGIYAR